jgi:hypothetical protein
VKNAMLQRFVLAGFALGPAAMGLLFVAQAAEPPSTSEGTIRAFAGDLAKQDLNAMAAFVVGGNASGGFPA